MPRIETRNQCPKCSNLKPSSNQYCTECAPKFNTSRWAVRNAAVKAQFGKNPYKDGRYLFLRKQAIERDKGLCVRCFTKGLITPFNDVDHIKPISQGGDFYSLDNLQCLCSECHAIKTANESKEAKKI